jgi:hypothetical protein
LPASSRATGTIAEVLKESCVVSLHPRSSRCVTITHCAVDHVEATLPLVQSQLQIGTATAREVLRPPLDVKNAVGSRSTYRCEDAEPTIDQIEVVPVREDGVVVGGPWQALISKGRIGSQELRVTIRRQIDAGESRAVQRIREWQRDGSDRVIPVIADVGCTWHDAAPYLSDYVLPNAGGWSRRRCWSW